MNNKAIQEKSDDQPLFILKYRWLRKSIPISGLVLCVLFVGICTFFAPGVKLSSRIIGLFIFLLFLLRLIDLLLFREIRLYKDRIAKVWKLTGTREIMLANARLRSYWNPTLGVCGKSISNQNLNEHWGWILNVFLLSGVSYLEHLADPKDVKKLNSLLAEISGRKIEDFEQTAMFRKLIVVEDV
ncbi:hypothetical protein [Desulfomonile tiedjei]|uniref:DUF304 domain-containing protein n=1 Tax=Desulfomonile tiedjei (strain ATCC 49306 / DSM 6799 / DCB-1) TaxID=706587 RepID=I4C7G0_DESTA|nr:hypothetical protein [Desulfomonile tiedjei]AFM25501.1 hypothetical protein Desti_2831 [Desulfomonile tiedjei DSM 6799]